MTVLEHTSLIQASRQSRYRMRGSISQMFAERLMRRPRPTVARRSRLRYHTMARYCDGLDKLQGTKSSGSHRTSFTNAG